MKRIAKAAMAAAFAVFAFCEVSAIAITQAILPVSSDEINLGEWNRNFSGGLAIANTFHIPLVVFYGGLSCGKCEMLQRACLTEEFVSWQNANKMVMIFTTDNRHGNASAFASPSSGGGFPYIAVYWNREGENAPARNSQYYRTFTGRDGQMLATGGSLASQLRRSIEMVTEGYVYDPALDVGITEHAEMVYSTPVTTRLRYDISLFAMIDAASAFEPQRVYNVSDLHKVTLKKINGMLPAGVKLVYAGGGIAITGAAKATGHFSYMFSIVQKRNNVVYEGPPITIDATVNSSGDVAAGGNALLGTAFKSTVPLFLPESGGNVLKGVLEIAHTARNVISAKYYGLSRRTTSFKGTWASLSGGVASAALKARDGKTLTLSLGEGGGIEATLGDPAYPAPITTACSLHAGTGDYASAFVGGYTACLVDRGGGTSGAGYVVIKRLSADGKAQWVAGLPNGTTLSGAANVALDIDGNAVLPVFKVATKGYVAAAVRILPNGSAASSPRAVVGCAGAVARWGTAVKDDSACDCDVFGSRYNKNFSLEESCLQQYATAILPFSAAPAGFSSGRYGALVSAPSGEVKISSDGISLASGTSDIKLSFAKDTGMFKGSIKLVFDAGATTAKFAGVVVPGWHGSVGADGSDPYSIDVSRPFAMGAVFFSDVDGGLSVKRHFMVKIGEAGE